MGNSTADSYGRDGVVMAAECKQFFSCTGIPNFDGPVSVTGEEPIHLGVKCDRNDGTCASDQGDMVTILHVDNVSPSAQRSRSDSPNSTCK